MPDIKKFFPSQKVSNWTSGAFGGGTVAFSASGGTENTYTDSGHDYKSHTFTSSGTFTVLGGSSNVWVFLVAGGGAGGAQNGNDTAGGAGAGGFLLATTSVASNGGNGVGAYTVTIGAGGAAGYVYPYGGHTADKCGINGNNSTFNGLVAIGGGGGGVKPVKDTSGGVIESPNAGGCGAGVGAQSGNYWKGMYGVQGGRGNDPSGSMHSEVGAGGGGHGGGGIENRNGYAGAANYYKDGTSITYGGGGGGTDNGAYASWHCGSGGTGGGGAAHAGTSGNATSATANTGGGGGTLAGGYHYSTMYAGSGGSGIIIIRYAV